MDEQRMERRLTHHVESLVHACRSRERACRLHWQLAITQKIANGDASLCSITPTERDEHLLAHLGQSDDCLQGSIILENRDVANVRLPHLGQALPCSRRGRDGHKSVGRSHQFTEEGATNFACFQRELEKICLCDYAGHALTVHSN